MRLLKKLSLFALALSLSVGVLTACGSDTAPKTVGDDPLPFAEVYKDPQDYPYVDGYNTVTNITVPAGATLLTSSTSSSNSSPNQFLTYRANGKYFVYGADANKNVLEIDATVVAADSDISTSNEFIRVVRTDAASNTKTTTVYGKNGNELAKADGAHAISASSDGFALNGKFYHMEDGTLKNTYELAPFTNLSSITFTDHYAIKKDAPSVVYYDQNFTVAASYTLPMPTYSYNFFLLEDEKLLVQYTVPCAPESNDYDLFLPEASSYSGSLKVKLHHILFDPAENEAKDLSLGVRITGVYNRHNDDSFDEFYADTVKNVMSYYSIKDKLVDHRAGLQVILENDGSFGASLSGYAQGQCGPVQSFGSDYFKAETFTGVAIFDKNGTVVREVPTTATATKFGYYDTSARKIYDKNFTLVKDLTEYSMRSSYGVYDSAVFYEKIVDGKTYLYRYDKNGEHEIKASIKGATLSSYSLNVTENYYTVSYTVPSTYETLYDLYSLEGTLLLTAKSSSFSKFAETEDAVILSFTATSNMTAYARLSK